MKSSSISIHMVLFFILFSSRYKDFELGGARGVMVIVVGNGHGEFKSWTRLSVFHIALILLEKV